ncbi:MAG TPA: 30S ribosomal protein S18 [Rickettsiales bacterium]|nr:30S ribosomal protein S18 [Rickettsiales bacterium]
MVENQQNTTQNQEKDDYLKISLVNQGISIKKNRVDPLLSISEKDIDYKNLELINKYISERGKIMASRITGIPLKKQRKLAKAIKRARNLALMSFIAKIDE